MRALSGILPPSRGEIFLKGSAIGGMPVSQRVSGGLVLVLEGRHLFAQISVEENLELGAYLLPAAERCCQLADTMSGGERQMVAAGRALMGRPRCMLLDEPSLGLAPSLVAELFCMLQRICDAGTGVLLVEQNVRQALGVGDHADILEQEQVVAEGSGSALLAGERIRKSYQGL